MLLKKTAEALDSPDPLEGEAVLILRTDDDWEFIQTFDQALLDSPHFVTKAGNEILTVMQTAWEARGTTANVVRGARNV